MIRMLSLTALLIVILGAYYFFVPSKSSLKTPTNTTLIVTAFGGKNDQNEWEGEVAPYIEKVADLSDISNEVSMCEHLYKGQLYGAPVIIAVTGTGKVNATACTLELLEKTNGRFEEVILSGIAGISPTKGKIPVMIGDVCINSNAIDFASQYFTSDAAGTKAPAPTYWSIDTDNLSSKTTGSAELARELYHASLLVEWPTLKDSIKAINTAYNGVSRIPKAWGPNECIEASDDLFWHDIRSDQRARELGAIWIKESLNFNVEPDNIIVVTAMEAAPVGSVIEKWNNSHNSNIKFGYVRGASNFDHASVTSSQVPKISGKESIERRESEDGVSTASLSAALTVLKTLELRQE